VSQGFLDRHGRSAPPSRRRERRADVATYRVRVDLTDTSPPLWRRLELASDMRLDELRAGSAPRAVCTDGRRPGPTEDCGGVHGYELYIAAADTTHPDHTGAVARHSPAMTQPSPRGTRGPRYTAWAASPARADANP
jgi:pRiA4b ORF-3-like protein